MPEYRNAVTILHTPILPGKYMCWIIIIFLIYYIKMQETINANSILFSEKSILNKYSVHHSGEKK